jgi:hypothetical protein
MRSRAAQPIALGADIAAELPVGDRLGEVRQPVGPVAARPGAAQQFGCSHANGYRDLHVNVACGTVARRKPEGPRMAETTTVERSARYRAGLAQQLRAIRLELAAIRGELESRLPALTWLLAEDEPPAGRRQ